MKAKKVNQFSPGDVGAYLKQSGLPADAQADFQVRHKIRCDYGVDENWTGEGVTRWIDGSQTYGTVELLVLDNHPKPLAALEQEGLAVSSLLPKPGPKSEI